ncbi:MAG: hypothetical protein KAJ64_01825 [Thermoplasmata archaeon]|nr:hypothetical protein [Thermoplasmata archaeon]
MSFEDFLNIHRPIMAMGRKINTAKTTSRWSNPLSTEPTLTVAAVERISSPGAIVALKK